LAFSENGQNMIWTIAKYLGLMVLNAFALVIVYAQIQEGDPGLGIVFAIVTLGTNIIIFVPSLYPLRWMTPGLILIVLLVIYPVFFTIQTAFTNYGDGHLFTRDQAIGLISERGYVPEEAITYSYTPYRSGEEDYALWLINDATGEISWAVQGESIRPVDITQFGFALPGNPDSNGFTELEQPGPLIGAIGGQTTEFEFDAPINQIAVTMGSPEATETDAQYIVTATQQMIYNVETGQSLPVTVLQRGDEFGFYWEEEDGTTYLARPGEPIYVNSQPAIEGFSPISISTLADEGIETLSFNDPIDEIEIGSISPVTQDDFGSFIIQPQYIFDPEEALTRDQRTGRQYDTTVFENPEGQYAYWMTESGGASRVSNAILIRPEQGTRDIEITDRRVLNTLNIDLTAGATIPERIGPFERSSAGEDLYGQTVEGVTNGFEIAPVDFEQEYVLDPDQGLMINYANGLIYAVTLYENDNGDYGLWMDSDTRERGRIDTILARPEQALIVNGTPAEFEGYNLAITDRERAEAVQFLQNLEADYFGAPDELATERIGIITRELGKAGQPFLLRYVYNEAESSFVDLSTINVEDLDLDGLDLDIESPYNVPGFLDAVTYQADDEDGAFIGSELRFVYNEVEESWVDLASVNTQNAADVSGETVATQALGSIPGFGDITRVNEYPEQGVFAPQGLVYNSAVNAFVQGDDDLATASETELIDAGATYYVFDEVIGLYVPPSWAYNETENVFFNLSEVDVESLNLSGISLQDVIPAVFEAIAEEEITLYTQFESTAAGTVYAPPEWVYNSDAQAFVDFSSLDDETITREEVQTADLSSEAYQRADFLRYIEGAEVFAESERYLYNSVENAFIDLNTLPDEIDPATVDLAATPVTEIDGLASTDLVEINDVRGAILYEETAQPTYNETVDAYIYLPDLDDTTLTGIDLGTYDPATASILAEVNTVRAAPNSVRISPLVYMSELERPTLDGDRYVLQLDETNELTPGYRVNIGLDNFARLFEDERYYSPLLDVFVWTVAFALLSVLTTFVVGLFMAIVLNDDTIPGKKIVRSLLIIPYAVPGVIGILVWQGMLNENLGIITNAVADVFGLRLTWFTDPTLAKIAIIIVNLWLGYPYMMLVCSGALSAIPSDVYEAAAVDGARPMQRFWNITLPLLLVTVGPLLIASFTFNFNNYLMIELLTAGDPPIPGTPTDVGYTDILISYTYNLAFGTSRGADYGYASAITLVIFVLVAIVTLFQFRFTRQWEEVGENV